MAESAGDCRLYCCVKCKAFFVDSASFGDHRKNCNVVVPSDTPIVVQLQKAKEEVISQSSDPSTLDESPSPKRCRQEPQTLFVEMIELPTDVEQTIAIANDLPISEEQEMYDLPDSEFIVENALEDGESSSSLGTVEITVHDHEQSNDEESVSYLQIVPDEDSIEGVNVPSVEHETRVEQSQTRYTPRNETPKQTDYTVTVENGKEVYRCRFCPYKSKHLHMLGRHLSTHNDNGSPFVCDVCQFQCMFRGLFHAHQRKHSRPYKCERCNYSSSNVRDLNRHNLRHEGLAPFVCDICDRQFRQKTGLEIHKRTHTGDLFQCGIEDCEYKTPNPQTMRTHQQRIHNAEQRETLKCPTCDFTCKTKNSLNYHQKSHLGLKDNLCPYCSYTSIKASEVKRHMKRHFTEKLFRCDRCEFETMHSSALKSHLLGHTNKKAFSCPLCEYSHSSKVKIQKHVDEYHPNEASNVRINGIRLNVDLDAFRIQNPPKNDEKVIKLKYGTIETEAITVDDKRGISNVSMVKGLYIQGTEVEDEKVGTFQCQHCRFKCFSDAALASHNIQCHEENLFAETEAGEVVIDSDVVSALASVQAHLDVETS